MKKKVNQELLDTFRLVAAFLVVAIHTSPLSSVSKELDFMAVHVAARIAVPFFLMLTGFFILPAARGKTEPVIRFLKRTGLLYLSALLLYLPVNLYAGQLTWGNILKKLLFDGTFYHLWYLPAVLLGLSLVSLLSYRHSLRYALLPAVLLYIIGLFGDSYYGLLQWVPVLSDVYEGIFTVSSYTRNGIFYAPLFLVLGGLLGEKREWGSSFVSGALSLLFFLLLLLEGGLVHSLLLSRHDSMYVTLPFAMWFLFSFLAGAGQGKEVRKNTGEGIQITEKSGRGMPIRRVTATGIYVLHPLVILAVRGFAKMTGTETLLVKNSVIHYLAVCLFSFLLARSLSGMGMCWQHRRRKRKKCKKARAWLELDCGALKENVRLLSEKAPDGCILMPAVKANAYGHGVVPVARELNRLGICHFCVAEIREGIALRKGHIRGEILILGYTHPSQLFLLQRYRLTQTVVDCEYAGMLSRYVRRVPGKIRVQVKVDTGMHRLGECASHVERIAEIWNYGGLRVTGIYTHLCAADSKEREDVEYTIRQLQRFDRLTEALCERGIRCPPRHVQSSCGLLNDVYREFFRTEREGKMCAKYEFARPGIALYGLMSRKEDAALFQSDLPLSPVLSLYARVVTVKDIKRGECAGYGRAYTAPRDGRLAVLSIGYADGIPRSMDTSRAFVLIGGKKAPVVGRICMDQMLVDVSMIKEAAQGDIAVLIGTAVSPSGGTLSITAEDMAQWAGTITNELVSRLSGRLERVMEPGLPSARHI